MEEYLQSSKSGSSRPAHGHRVVSGNWNPIVERQKINSAFSYLVSL